MSKRHYDAARESRPLRRDRDDDGFNFGGRGGESRRSQLTIPWLQLDDMDDEFGDDFGDDYLAEEDMLEEDHDVV